MDPSSCPTVKCGAEWLPDEHIFESTSAPMQEKMTGKPTFHTPEVGTFLFLALLVAHPLLAQEVFPLNEISEQFPYRGFEDRIEFWKRIFTRYGERQVVFHDQDDLRLIYEIVTFEKGTREDAKEALRQRDWLAHKKQELQGILYDLSESGPDSNRFSRRHREVINLLRSWRYPVSPASLRERAKNIRYQRGIKERFSESMVRSGKYLSLIEESFHREGLPPELALLPLVESSFDYQAYSRKGAAGIWQFIPSTGRRFLKINAYVDELRGSQRRAAKADRCSPTEPMIRTEFR